MIFIDKQSTEMLQSTISLYISSTEDFILERHPAIRVCVCVCSNK